MRPIVQKQSIHLFGLVVLRKVDSLFLPESDIVFILEEIYLLRIVHDEHALQARFLFHIVLDTLAIRFEHGQLPAGELVDLMLRNLVWLRRMELHLEDFVDISRAFSEEDFLVISSDQMPSDHSLRVADHFEEITI